MNRASGSVRNKRDWQRHPYISTNVDAAERIHCYWARILWLTGSYPASVREGQAIGSCRVTSDLWFLIRDQSHSSSLARPHWCATWVPASARKLFLCVRPERQPDGIAVCHHTSCRRRLKMRLWQAQS